MKQEAASHESLEAQPRKTKQGHAGNLSKARRTRRERRLMEVDLCMPGTFSLLRNLFLRCAERHVQWLIMTKVVLGSKLTVVVF